MRERKLSLAAFAVLAAIGTGCAGGAVRATLDNPTPVDIAKLWQDPVDLASRDLFHGPGGPALRPDGSTPFAFVAADRTGFSSGYDVSGPDGTIWSVKLGPEAQPEVVVSRILWAIGYHQPPTYYLETWTMTGAQAGPQPAGRFRPGLPERELVAEWSWYENDFVATQPFKGLVTANLLLNNWDWKTSNNKVYQVRQAEPGAPTRLHVVQDLGASLGRTSYPKIMSWFPMRGLGQGSRNDIDGFEQQDFIKRVDGDRVEFHYRGIHRPVVDSLTARDVVWTCELMSRLTDAQWQGAFRAAGYPPDHAGRYIRKIKQKIGEGLALAPGGTRPTGGA